MLDSSFIVEYWIAFFALIAVIMNVSIIGLILRKREQASNRVTWYLIGTIISISIWIITVFMQIEYFTIDDNLVANTIVASISNVVILLGLTLMAGFAKLLVEPTINFIQMRILVGLTGMVSGIYVVSIYLVLDDQNIDRSIIDTISVITDLINLFVTILVIVFIQTDLTKLLNEPLSEIQKKQINYVNRSLLIGLIGILPIIFVASIYGIRLLAIAFIIISIALFFLINAYLIDPRVAFILPHRTYLAIVVNEAGILRYSRDFMGNRDLKSTLLISSALSAIVSLMAEFYDAEIVPTLLKFQERLILFSIEEKFFLAVFTDRDSPLIRTAMSNTVKEIKGKFDSLDHISGAKTLQEDWDDIFDKTFYFIY